MFSEDSGCGLSVNVSFSDNDLDEQVGCRAIGNVPLLMPSVDLAEAWQGKGSKNAFNYLHVFLSTSQWEVDEGRSISK